MPLNRQNAEAFDIAVAAHGRAVAAFTEQLDVLREATALLGVTSASLQAAWDAVTAEESR